MRIGHLINFEGFEHASLQCAFMYSCHPENMRSGAVFCQLISEPRSQLLTKYQHSLEHDFERRSSRALGVVSRIKIVLTATTLTANEL